MWMQTNRTAIWLIIFMGMNVHEIVQNSGFRNFHRVS